MAEVEKPIVRESDKRLATFIGYLKQNGYELHLPIKGTPFLTHRRPKFSRLTGLPK